MLKINNNSGIDNATFKFSYLGKYIKTNLGNSGKVIKEFLNYPEPCEWILDNGYILNEAMMYESGEEIIEIKEQFMLKIKDYIILKDIEQYLETKKDDLVRQEIMHNDCEIEELETLLFNLRKTLKKLENEE